MRKIAIIGTGNMGGAIAKSLSKREDFSLILYNKTTLKAEKLASEIGAEAVKSMEEIPPVDVVIIAVKPQVLPSIYSSLKKIKCSLFISLVAGVTLETLKDNLGTTSVARYMPNIGAMVGKSVTAVTYTDDLEEEKKELSLSVSSSFGKAFYLEESLFNAFIGISGSAIAFVYEFIASLALSGVREGIGYKKAEEIVSSTIESAIALQKETQKSATELEIMVCSPKGTTIEGVKKLKELNFENAVIEAVSASKNKADAMEKKTS